MLKLSAKIRKDKRKKVKNLRNAGILPAVVYGPKSETMSLELDYQAFEKIFKQAGESSLISLEIEGKKAKVPVLIHEIQSESVSGKIIHVDFYQASLTEEVTVSIPLIFEGEAPAVKDLGGTLIKNISELEVRALPEQLPHEIRINIEGLKNFDDFITVKDIKVADGVKILKSPDETIALVSQPEKVEEELVKPIEEKVEEVEKVATKKKEEVTEE